MIKKPILMMAVIAGLISLNLSASGQDDETTRCTLRGLEGVFVHVEPLDPRVEQDGLTKNQIHADTETKLKSAGIRVLTTEEFLKLNGHPYLYIGVNISVLRTQITRYLFYIRIELNQEVVLVRTPETRLSTVTWSAGGWGIDFSLDNIRQTIKTQVDKFINVYLAENRK
ncbi:MAG: hypothetical protein ACUVWO_12490 [Thermodesulfobacteriota bacterium]